MSKLLKRQHRMMIFPAQNSIRSHDHPNEDIEQEQIEPNEDEEIDHLDDDRVEGMRLDIGSGVFDVGVLENAERELGDGVAPTL